MAGIPVPMPWTAANQIPFYGADGPTVVDAPTDSDAHLTIGPGGELIWTRKGRVDLADEIDLLTGSDHSALLKSVIAAHGAGSQFYLRDGATLKLPLQLYSHAGGTGIPSLPHRSRLIGGGAGATLQITGWETIPNSSNYAAIEVYGTDKEDVVFADLRVVGDWTARGSGPGTWTNGQPASIWVYGTDDTLKRVHVVRCVFEDHFGFPVHFTGSETHSVIDDSAFLNCGNGLNVNSDYSVFRHNRFEASEGIECSGLGVVIDGNVMTNMVGGAISVGGNVGSDSYPGNRVTNNVIIVCDGVAIITAESSGDLLVAGNYIERAKDFGISLSGGAATSGPTDGIRCVDNSVVSTSVGGTACGIRVTSRCGKVYLGGNRIYNKSGYATMVVGAVVESADVVAVGNDFNGANYSVQFSATASNVLWDESNTANSGVNGIYSIDAGASFAPGSVLQIKQPSSSWKPTAAARFRGVTINYSAQNGSADYKQICTKDATDAYGWRDLF